MQVTRRSGGVRGALATLGVRAGTAALFLHYLITAVAAPAFWRSARPRPLDEDVNP